METNDTTHREQLEALAKHASEWGTTEEAAALQWALSHVPASREIVRHVKRGSEYEVLGEAEGQVSEGKYLAVPKGDTTGDGLPSRLVHDGIMLTIYRCEKTGKLWYRFPDEFRDGRFVLVP